MAHIKKLVTSTALLKDVMEGQPVGMSDAEWVSTYVPAFALHIADVFSQPTSTAVSVGGGGHFSAKASATSKYVLTAIKDSTDGTPAIEVRCEVHATSSTHGHAYMIQSAVDLSSQSTLPVKAVKLNEGAALPFTEACEVAGTTFKAKTGLSPTSEPGTVAPTCVRGHHPFRKTKQIVSSQTYKYQYWMGPGHVDSTPEGWNDFQPETFDKLTDLVENWTGAVGSSVIVQSGYFAYAIAFCKPDDITTAQHLFCGAPITAGFVGVQTNTYSKTRRTIQRVRMDWPAPSVKMPLFETIGETEAGFKSEMETQSVPFGSLGGFVKTVGITSASGGGGTPVALEEKLAARAYTGEWIYQKLNQLLRDAGGKSTPLPFQHCIGYLSKAIKAIPLPASVTGTSVLYRGQPGLFGLAYNAGDVVTWDAFTSISTDKGVATCFGGSTLFEITGVDESCAGGLQPVSVFPTEAEVLLMAGTQLCVVDHSKNGSMSVIRLKVV
jgi:hypothetical protein